MKKGPQGTLHFYLSPFIVVFIVIYVIYILSAGFFILFETIDHKKTKQIYSVF